MGLDKLICGGHNPLSDKASDHAESYYESIRRQIGDIAKIAKNTQFTLEQISLVKAYIFFSYHDLERDRLERFDPDYIMGESWRRLSSLNKNHIQPHDILLLEHELLEIQYILQGYTQNQAHTEASKTYDYSTAALNFYRRQGFNI